MLRSSICALSWVGCLTLACAGNLRAAEEGRLSEVLLPDTTQGFAAISNGRFPGLGIRARRHRGNFEFDCRRRSRSRS